MPSSASHHEQFDHWKARLFDGDERTGLEATAALVEAANAAKELRPECACLLALRLEQLHKSGDDVFFTLEALANLSRGIIAASEPLLRALLKIPVKDSYALNMATSILLDEMSHGFIKADHPLEEQVWNMASETAKKCKGDARRNALQILELAKGNCR